MTPVEVPDMLFKKIAHDKFHGKISQVKMTAKLTGTYRKIFFHLNVFLDGDFGVKGFL